MTADKVINAINMLDLKQLSLENVELLQRMVPSEQESKAYREYIIEKKNVNLLTEEDKFLMQLTKVERISAKLAIMSYIGNFFDNLHLVTPVSKNRKLNEILSTLFFNFFTASTFDNLCVEFREKLKKIEICVGSYLGVWKLSEQLQTRTSIRFQVTVFGYSFRYQIDR